VIFASFHPCPELVSGKEKKDKKTAFLLSLLFHKPHYVCLFIKEKKK